MDVHRGAAGQRVVLRVGPSPAGRRPGTLVSLPGRRDTGPMPAAVGVEHRLVARLGGHLPRPSGGPAAAERDPAADDLDRLATAAYLTGRDEQGFQLWERAHRACLDAGDIPGAARSGIRLAECLGFKGDLARARGWVDRTRHLLDQAQAECVEQGYLDHAAAVCRILETGDVAGAHAGFVRAMKTSARFEDRELATLARIGLGRCLIYLGEVSEGLGHLDEAMVAVESREISPVAVGDCYCTVIDACRELFDVRRLEAWTESFARWFRSHGGLAVYGGHCSLHRAELLAPARRLGCGADRGRAGDQPAHRAEELRGARWGLLRPGGTAAPAGGLRGCGRRLPVRPRARLRAASRTRAAPTHAGTNGRRRGVDPPAGGRGGGPRLPGPHAGRVRRDRPRGGRRCGRRCGRRRTRRGRAGDAVRRT